MTTREMPIQEAADAHYTSRFAEIAQMLRIRKMAEVLGHSEWAEQMTARLDEEPLSVCLQRVNMRNETCEWEILLGTGGPADRVMVVTSFDGDVESASYQFQDWFTSWTEAENQDEEIVEEFARCFYFGQVAVTVDGCSD
jgi:hypothetical protein